MIHGQTDKAVVVLKPQSVATNATATGVVDTLGFSYAQFDITLDSVDDATNLPTALKIEEADAATGTYAGIAALTGGTATGNFTLPTPGTALPTIIRLNVNLNGGRKRFLRLSLTQGGAASLAAATARLTRAAEVPTNAAGAGAILLVNA